MQPFANYTGHVAHALLGAALAQPFLDLPSLTTRLCLVIVLSFTLFFHGFQLLLHQAFPPGEFDMDTALMIYAMLLRILPETVLHATGIGLLICAIVIFSQQFELQWMIGRV